MTTTRASNRAAASGFASSQGCAVTRSQATCPAVVAAVRRVIGWPVVQVERAMSRSAVIRRPRRKDARGEVLPVAILFVGVLLTIMIGIHVLVVALARTAVQSAADAAVSAAQAAGEGSREREGVQAARRAMAGASGSVSETRLPVVAVEPERGSVSVVVYGGIISPVLGELHLTAQACGPLDDVPAPELTVIDAWQC